MKDTGSLAAAGVVDCFRERGALPSGIVKHSVEHRRDIAQVWLR
jgi:hypothetical protein